MSLDLHGEHLSWNGSKGWLQTASGVRMRLTSVPNIGIKDVTDLWFTPDIHVYTVQERCDRVRDLEEEEIRCIRAMLERVDAAAQAALAGSPV
jgi:hypothetical protein